MENLIPKVEIPVIQFRQLGQSHLYVEMNIKSLIYTSPQKKESKIGHWDSFLFEVKLSRYEQLSSPQKSSEDNNYYIKSISNIRISEDYHDLPIIQLVGNFPIIFHPHFEINYYGSSSRWKEYKRKGWETKLGDYLLRIAHSLAYQPGYIDTSYPTNSEALRFYQDPEYREYFPTDNIQLPITFPTGKNFSVQNQHKFEIGTNVTISPSSNLQQTGNSLQVASRNLKFEIEKQKLAYILQQKSKHQFKINKNFSSNYKNNYEKKDILSKAIGAISEEIGLKEKTEASHKFYLTSSAFNQIREHIEWGKKKYKNIVEQGGILVGHTFIDPETNMTYGIAEEVVKAQSARGSAIKLEMTHETWQQMLEETDRLHQNLQIIGWYHTHPNHLDVFMSPDDIGIQERFFNNDWQFAIVLNPQKQIWRSFYGAEANECRGFVIQEDTEEYTEEISTDKNDYESTNQPEKDDDSVNN